jgi:hypothetical protein
VPGVLECADDGDGFQERAIDNADSHEYFGENEPRQDIR